MIDLDESVRLVNLQFNFSNERLVPAWMPSRDAETFSEQKERASRANDAKGEMVISPTEFCSLAMVVDDLKEAGYELVDGYHQERINPKNSRKQPYHMVRFVFLRRDSVDELRDELGSTREKVVESLGELCLLSMWRVRAFQNPFFQNGEAVDGLHAVSINLEARKPLFQPDGKPLLVWQKDENSKRVGDAPQPIQAKKCLCIQDDIVQIAEF